MRDDAPFTATELDDDALATAYRVPDRDRWTRDFWVRVNFVMSLDGAIVGAEGLSKSLGTDADTRVFRLARRMSDVILVGAGTLRMEDYRPSPRPLAIVTRRLDLDPGLRVFAERGPEHVRPFVMTTSRAMDDAPEWLRDQAELLDCGADDVDLHRALDHLTARGLTHMLCEGGPALLTHLLEAELVDELLLTIVPTLVGSDEHLVRRAGGFSPPVRLQLTQVLEDDGTVLTRYSTRNRMAP